jgi:Zn-dependent peptidase ImmA (M78 family)
MKDPSLLSLRDVTQQAELFLKTHHPSRKLPIPIEEIVEIRLDIRIVLIRGLIRDFGVNAFINQKFDAIIIDEMMYSKQPERIRFTIAEEIGHLLLHKEWYSKYGPKGMGDYLDWQTKFDHKRFDYIERQAKTFASMVLIPQDRMVEKWKIFVSRNSISSPCSVYDLPDTFPQLAHEFRVSPDSLLVRLSFLKLVVIPDGFWQAVRKRR